MSNSHFIKNKLVRFFATGLISAVCLYYVADSFNWKQIGDSLRRAHLIYFFLGSVSSQLVFFLFRAVRWQLLLSGENLSVPFVKLYLYNSVSIGISNVTPFQSGEALKVELLRKYGGQRLTGYTIFFLEKCMDFSVAICLSILGVLFGFDFGPLQFYFYIFAVVFIAGFAAMLGVLFFLPFKRLDPIKILMQEKLRKKWLVLSAFFFTFCSWVTAAVGWKMALISVSIDITFLQALSLVSLTMLVTIISFVPGAAGVSEISIVTILTQMGIELASAQTGAVVLRLFALTLLGLTFLHWVVLKFLTPKPSIAAACES